MWQCVQLGRGAIVGLILVQGLLFAGCSALVDAKAGSAVTGSLRALERQDNREALRKLLTSPEVQESTQALTQTVLDVAWEDLSREERRARARELTAELVDSAGPALARILDRDVLPRVREELSASLEAALERVFTEENRGKAADFASGVARAAFDATRAEISQAIQSGVAAGIDAGIGRSLDGRIVPAVHQALAGGSPAFARTLRAGTEGALLGAADALHGELGAVLREDRQAFLKELQAVAAAERQAWIEQLRTESERVESRWKRWFVTLAIAAGVVLLAAAVWLTLLLRENRRLKSA